MRVLRLCLTAITIGAVPVSASQATTNACAKVLTVGEAFEALGRGPATMPTIFARMLGLKDVTLETLERLRDDAAFRLDFYNGRVAGKYPPKTDPKAAQLVDTSYAAAIMAAWLRHPPPPPGTAYSLEEIQTQLRWLNAQIEKVDVAYRLDSRPPEALDDGFEPNGAKRAMTAVEHFFPLSRGSGNLVSLTLDADNAGAGSQVGAATAHEYRIEDITGVRVSLSAYEVATERELLVPRVPRAAIVAYRPVRIEGAMTAAQKWSPEKLVPLGDWVAMPRR